VILRWTRLTAFLLLLASRVLAQGPAAPPAGEPGSDLTIDILTIGPGEEVWELWGHNAIVVSDRADSSSLSYNYGLFDFRQKDFYLRFIRGQMLYAMGSRATARDLDLYARRDRSMELQDLALTPAEKLQMQQFLEWNDTEVNRNYHYNYYLDNCSTRVRDAIDKVLGGQFQRTFGAVPSGHTWRWETRRILGWDLPLYTGIMLALGHPVDREMTAWQAMFLPLRLREALQTVKIADSSGAMVPLVRAADVLQRSTRFTDPAAPRPTWIPLLLIGLLGGAILAWLGGASVDSRGARWGFGILATGWSLTAGVLGVVLRGLWFLTDHWAASMNENILLVTPISLALVVLIPMALRGRGKAGLWAVRVAAVVAFLSALALVIKVLPWFNQYNIELIGLILPIHVGVLIGLRQSDR
jgi:hypothetical protein